MPNSFITFGALKHRSNSILHTFKISFFSSYSVLDLDIDLIVFISITVFLDKPKNK